ncbi:MAG: hypothetical protein WD081_00355 [Gammaproteobacteria bacterium]
MNLKIPAALAAFLLVGGCSSVRCGEPGPYMNAEVADPIAVPEGLAAPDTSRKVRIPEAADVVHTELRGTRYLGDDGRLHCLDSPPPMARKIGE